MPRKKQKNKPGDLKIIGLIAISLLVIVGLGTWWAYSYSTSMVKKELSQQRIFFPQKGSQGFSEQEYPGLQQYAGQQLTNGVQAKAYANEYIGHHLEKIAGGKTYSEVSGEAMKNPADEKLAAQKQQLFMGETLRGLLLNAYAFWTIGKLLMIVSLVSFLGAGLIGLLLGKGLLK